MKSKCCNAPVTVWGETTQYYICLDCEKATDPQEEIECSHLWYPYCTYKEIYTNDGNARHIVEEVFCQKCLKILEINNPQ